MKLDRQSIIFYSQLLVIVTLPFHFLASSYTIGILMLVFFYSVFKSNSFREEVWSSFSSHKIAQIFVLIFIVYVGSTLLHLFLDHDNTIQSASIEQRLSFLIFPFLFANIRSYKPKQIKSFFRVYIGSIVASTFIALSIGLYYTISTNSLYFYDSGKQVVFNNFMYHRLGSYVGMHAVYYAEYVLLAFIMWVNYSYYHFSKWNIKFRLLAILLGIYFVGVIFLLKSATILLVLLSIICFFTIYFLYKEKERIGRPKKIIIGIMGILLVIILGNQAISKIGSKADFFTYDISQPGGGEWNGINLRLAKWDVAKLAIKDNWLIGVGPGNTVSTLDTYYEKVGFTYALQLHYNPHNQFLHTFLTLGIIGVLLLTVLFLLSILTSAKKKDSVMFLFIISFLLFSLSESTLAVNKGIVFFSIFLCFF